MKFIKIFIQAFLCICATNVFAQKYWFNLDNDWEIYFDNGDTYISSPSLEPKCNYSRASLSSTYGDEVYRNRMYSYILTASTMGKKMQIVLDDTQDKSIGINTRCEFYGANAD